MWQRALQEGMLPEQLADLYRKYSFTGIDDNGAFAYDTVDQWMDMTVQIQERLFDALAPLKYKDVRLYAQELEFLSKLGVCWRCRGKGTLFNPDLDYYTCSNPNQAEQLRADLHAYGQLTINALEAMSDLELAELWQGAPLKLDKGKGAPYWYAGNNIAICMPLGRLAVGHNNYDSLVDATRSAGNARMDFVSTSYIRVQSARGLQPDYDVRGGRLVQVGERSGPKVRRIAAQPFSANHLWTPIGAILRHIMASTNDGRNTGTVDVAKRAASTYKYTVAVDLKAYDTTVSAETLDLIGEVLIAPVLHHLQKRLRINARYFQLLLDIWRHTNHIPVLLPPRNSQEEGYIVEALGQIRSGVNLTSWIGTVINRCRIDAKMRHLGIDPESTFSVNYGDDTVIFANDKRVIDKWADNTKYLGFEETVAVDATFLMRRLPNDYGYLGRMVMGCVNREPSHEPANTFSASAAFATRRQLLYGHPLEHTFYDILDVPAAPIRFRNAIRIAAQITNAPAATWQAAQIGESRQGRQVEDIEETMKQLSVNVRSTLATRQSALDVLTLIDDTLSRTKKRLSWREFTTLRDEFSVEQAKQRIAETSYAGRPRRYWR
jgi:hypothetical protein